MGGLPENDGRGEKRGESITDCDDSPSEYFQIGPDPRSHRQSRGHR